jgi:hypothetical protein
MIALRGYGRYVVTVRYDENTPVSMLRTDDLADAEKARVAWPGAVVYDSERARYVESES